MKKKVLGLGLLVVAIAMMIPTLAGAATLEVGEGKVYATIAAAYNAAVSGDIIKVFPGVYQGAVLSVAKPNITFEGAKAGISAKDGTRSKGDGTDSVIKANSNANMFVIQASGISFDGFVFDGVNNATGGVPIQHGTKVERTVIANNVFTNNHRCIYALASSGACTVNNNWFDGYRNSALYSSFGSVDFSITDNRFSNGPKLVADCLQMTSEVGQTQKVNMKFNRNVMENVSSVAGLFNAIGFEMKNNTAIMYDESNVRMFGSMDATSFEDCVITDNDFKGGTIGIFISLYGTGGLEVISGTIERNSLVVNPVIRDGDVVLNSPAPSYTGTLIIGANHWGGGVPLLTKRAAATNYTADFPAYYSDSEMKNLKSTPTPARIKLVSVSDGQIGIDFDDPDFLSSTVYSVSHRALGATQWVTDGLATRGLLDIVTGLTNGTTYDFKVVSSYNGRSADSRIVQAKPQAPAAATTQPVPVVTQTQVDAGEVAPLTFVVPNSIIAGTTPSSDTVGPITVTIPAENQVKVNSLTITAMTTIPAGVIAPNTTVAPTRFIEIKPTGAAGVPVTTTDEYTKVVVGYAETVSSDLKNFALYYNHDRITYAVPKVANAAAGTGNFFWFDNGVARTYTFNTKVYSTLMGVVSTNAETEAEGNIDAPVIPTPASSAWTILALTLVALGVAAVVGRKV